MELENRRANVTFEALLSALSALLLQSAFMWPKYCAWMVFFFLIPILYCVTHFQFKRPFLTGMWWGMVFFSCHFVALFLVFYQKSQGIWSFIAPCIFTVYYALHAGLWFWVNSLILPKSSFIKLLIVWGMSTVLYFYWLCNCVLWPCGRLVGYCFGSPLLPLAQYPKSLFLLGYLGVDFLTLLLIGFQVLLFLALKTKEKKYPACALACFLPICVGWFVSVEHKAPDYLATVCYVAPPARTITHPTEQAEQININILESLQHKPFATCILMPESSFTHCLNDFAQILELWGLNALANDSTLCIGAYRRASEGWEYNTLFIIRQCRITKSYDKSFLMPFVEYLPSFCKNFECIRNLFLRNTSEFAPNKNCRRSLTLTNHLQVAPYLCSDMYMESAGEGSCYESDWPILLAVNDSWFWARYAQNLMYLYAVFYAMQYKKDILYVGHRFGCWINHATGKSILL